MYPWLFDINRSSFFQLKLHFAFGLAGKYFQLSIWRRLVNKSTMLNCPLAAHSERLSLTDLWLTFLLQISKQMEYIPWVSPTLLSPVCCPVHFGCRRHCLVLIAVLQPALLRPMTSSHLSIARPPPCNACQCGTKGLLKWARQSADSKTLSFYFHQINFWRLNYRVEIFSQTTELGSSFF